MNSQKGQAMILVVLVMTVVGVITTSLAGRTVTGLRTEEVANESARAFKAAEAGLERMLSQIGSGGTSPTITSSLDNNASYNTDYSLIGDSGLVSDDEVAVGDGIEIMTNGGSAISVMVYWNAGAVYVSEYYVDGSAGVKYYAYDADSSRVISNSFGTATSGTFTLGSNSFWYGKQINLSTGTRMLRIHVLYSPTKVAVAGVAPGQLPNQKALVEARGVFGGDVSGNVTRQISYTEMPAKLPSVFDYVLYNGSGALTQTQ